MKFNSFFRVIETYYEYLKFSFQGWFGENFKAVAKKWQIASIVID